MYDVPPPENDEQAKQMAAKIENGFHKEGQTGEEPKSDDSDDSDSEDTEKTKKKRSLFGRFDETKNKDFLSFDEIDKRTKKIIDLAIKLKKDLKKGQSKPLLKNKTMAMIFKNRLLELV